MQYLTHYDPDFQNVIKNFLCVSFYWITDKMVHFFNQVLELSGL